MTNFRIAFAIPFFFALTSTAAAATLTATPATVAPGGTVTVSWSDVTSPTRLDWIGKYVQGAPDGAYEDDFVYTSSCSPTGGAVGVASGSCTFTMPTSGAFEFRLFANNQNNLLAKSGLVQVSAPTASLRATPSTVAPGGSLTLSWDGIPNPTRLDWIGGYIQGSPDGAYGAFVYTSSCSATAGAAGLASGSCTVTMPTTPGTFEFRLFANDTTNLLAKSGPVQVAASTQPPALTATPSTVAPGGSVTVSWSDIPNPNRLDRIGRFVPGTPDSAFEDFVYTSSCTQTAGAAGAASGSCPFTMPATPGNYEFRLFANSATLLATSGLVEVSSSPPYHPQVAPEPGLSPTLPALC